MLPENIKDIVMFRFLPDVQKILGNNLQRMLLYGSYARGDYNANSDVDIMILTSLGSQEIEKIEPDIFDVATDIQLDNFIDISVLVKNEEQFKYWLGVLPFYDNVQREGIVLYGKTTD